MRIAIVGSEDKHWTPETRELACKEIKNILINDDYLEYINNNPYDVIYPTLISGGCPKGGIDIWAEIIADFIGLDKEIYLPEHKRVHRDRTWQDLQEIYGFDISRYGVKNKRKILRNCVEPRVGKLILDCAFRDEENQIKQTNL